MLNNCLTIRAIATRCHWSRSLVSYDYWKTRKRISHTEPTMDEVN